eukprot:1477142-Rhodomonas_salina.4
MTLLCQRGSGDHSWCVDYVPARIAMSLPALLKWASGATRILAPILVHLWCCAYLRAHSGTNACVWPDQPS